MTSMFKAVEVNDERGIRTVAPAETMLAWRKGLVLVPEVNDFTYVNPDPDFPQYLQKHQRAEPVQGNTIVRVLGFGAKPPPL